MKKKTMIKNTNIRLDLLKPEDRKAWEYLQTMDRKRYKSYSKAIVIAVNDYFSRQEQLEKDPYLETRAKEDAFLERILKTVREGAKEAMPEAALTEFVELLQRTAVLSQKEKPEPGTEKEGRASSQNEPGLPKGVEPYEVDGFQRTLDVQASGG